MQESFQSLQEERGSSLAEPDVLISAVGTLVYQRSGLLGTVPVQVCCRHDLCTTRLTAGAAQVTHSSWRMAEG